MSKKIKAKPKKIIKEAEDIILTSIDDKTAIRYLKEVIEDDFPDLDLGRMNLHDALSALDEKELKNKEKDFSVVENLNNALGDFIDTQEARMQKIIETRKAISEKRIASDKRDLLESKDNDEILPEIDDYDIEEDDYIYDYEETNERFESDSILPDLTIEVKKGTNSLEKAASIKKALAEKKSSEKRSKKEPTEKKPKRKPKKKKSIKKAKKK